MLAVVTNPLAIKVLEEGFSLVDIVKVEPCRLVCDDVSRDHSRGGLGRTIPLPQSTVGTQLK